jgi:UDP:flavonoid glycosyltransferase YjiC (YdhE family)
MKINLLIVGSRGDVQPAIALGIGLQKAGFDVQMVTLEEFRPLVRAYGLDFFPLSAHIQDLMNSKLVGMGDSGAAVFRIVPELLKMFRELFSQMTTDFWQACQGCDVVISNAATAMPAAAVAEKLAIPHIETSVFPGWPTRSFPSIFWPWPSKLETRPRGLAGHLKGAFNLLTYMPVSWAATLVLHPVIERCRREILGLPAKARSDGPGWHPAPYLSGFSEQVIPRPVDWKENIYVTGYWFVDTPAYEPPPALQAFLDAGAPPVYVGFGSIPSQNPEQVTRLVIQALDMAGQRGILLGGQGAMGGGMVPQASNSPVYFADSVPHDWLFPRMAAVVHHGGSGTTAAGIRAGAPSILVPIAGDQLLWAQQVKDLGIGPRPIPRKNLTAERLAGAITQAVTDQAMRQRAAALGEKVCAEDGVSNAVQVICQYVGG